jgi:RNA polymerase sigma factor (sigma-70 family)
MQVPLLLNHKKGADEHDRFNEVLTKLMERMRAGDTVAENELATALFTKVFAIIFYKAQKIPADAVEICQRVVMKAVLALRPGGQFDPKEGTNILGYVYAIVQREAQDFHRREAQRRKMAIHPDSDEVLELASIHPICESGRWVHKKMIPSHVHTVMSEEDRTAFPQHIGHCLREAMRWLDEREQLLFDLRFINGLSLEEIGEDIRFQITKERVRQLLARVVHKVRNVLLADAIIREYHDSVLSALPIQHSNTLRTFLGSDALDGISTRETDKD